MSKIEVFHEEDVSPNESFDEEILDNRAQGLIKSVGPRLAPLIPEYGAWYKKKHLLKLNLLLSFVCLTSSAQGYDNSLINSVLAFPEWEHGLMGSPEGEWLGFIIVTLSLGAIIGTFIAPAIGDRWGRLFSLRIGIIGLIVFALGQAFVKNDAQYMILRAFIGVSKGLCCQAVVLVAEISFPTYRGFFSCFYMTMYYAGSFLGAWVAYGARNMGDWSWRLVGLLQVAFPTLVLVAIFGLMPESPRWHLSKGNVEKAREILIKYHAGDDPEWIPVVEMEIEEILDQLEQDKQYANITWASMFKGRANLWRLFISITLGVFSQWNGVGVISYYLVGVLNSVGITTVTEQTLINGFLQLWNFIWAAGASFNVDRLGRRVLFLWSCIGMLISYIIITGLSAAYSELGNDKAGIAVVAFLFIYYAHYDIAFTPLLTCYPVEIWPYHQRSKGVAMALLSSYFSLLFNQFVNPIALGNIGWRYYFVYVGILIVMLVSIWFFYPETKEHSLEEVQEIFEGKKVKESSDEVN